MASVQHLNSKKKSAFNPREAPSPTKRTPSPLPGQVPHAGRPPGLLTSPSHAAGPKPPPPLPHPSPRRRSQAPSAAPQPAAGPALPSAAAAPPPPAGPGHTEPAPPPVRGQGEGAGSRHHHRDGGQEAARQRQGKARPAARR